MSDTKHISEIIDNISDQQDELAKLFGGLQAMAKLEVMSKMESPEQSYIRTIRYWMDKVSEAQYHIRKNQKKIEDLYEQP